MADLQTYKGANFIDVANDDMLDVYDTWDPTPIGTWEDGIVATYRFLDWEGNVLDSWTCKDWETPVYKGETPTKEHYHFTWWSPAVGPIYVNTDYTAQFEPDLYTITFSDLFCLNSETWEVVSGANWWSISQSSVQVPYWTYCSYYQSVDGKYFYYDFLDGHPRDGWQLINRVTISAIPNTASTRYVPCIAIYNQEEEIRDVDWEPHNIFQIVEDLSIENLAIVSGYILANFTIIPDDYHNWEISWDAPTWGQLPIGTVITQDNNNPAILSTEVDDEQWVWEAEPLNSSLYQFNGWSISFDGETWASFTGSYTVEADFTLRANFIQVPSHPLTMTVNNAEWWSITSQSYDEVQVGDVITYAGDETWGYIKCNNDNVSIVTVETGYEVDTVQWVPATYDGTPIVVSVIFKEWEK